MIGLCFASKLDLVFYIYYITKAASTKIGTLVRLMKIFPS